MVPVIILAAGTSKRMGSINKLLLPIDSKTMIKAVVEEYEKSKVSEIIVVVGHMWKSILKELVGKKVTIAYNSQYHSGMTSSIHVGLRHLQRNDHPFMIATADTPHIHSNHINQLIDQFQEREDENLILRSGSMEQPTHPTIFSAKFVDILFQSKEKDGCKGMIKAFKNDIEYLEANSLSLEDIDTVQDYNTLIHRKKH